MNHPLPQPADTHLENSKWTAARLSCGLGNRLFQLAAAHKVAESWRVPLVFAMPYCLPSEHGDFESIFKLFPGIQKLWKAEPLLAIDQERCFEFISFPHTPPADRILLRGHWQAADYISDSFKPSWDCMAGSGLLERWNLVTQEQQQKTAFLHVRLGDYRVLPHHQVNLLSYYVKAMAMFNTDTRFLVFSDEPAIAKTLLVFGDRCVFVDEAGELEALYLMSHCAAGAITANSTFSWWGAYFGRQYTVAASATNYRACMPARWMAVSTEPTDAIYPSWATKVDV
jgi:Glycosyl transferase family 11